jgi:hypothetical protein
VLVAKQGNDRVAAAKPFWLTTPRQMRRGTAVRGTAGWDAAMYEAKGQAELYVRNLPASEHNPPFIIVADVGHSMELFSDFSRQGRTYSSACPLASYIVASQPAVPRTAVPRRILLGAVSENASGSPTRSLPCLASSTKQSRL